ncbi:MAG: type II toxin-antitoxin system HicA family toxin, partial [Chloroflexi bacterium]|nr:type II toxin-antitoxin system HicA family toxin [Chloroflexota bacterium]
MSWSGGAVPYSEMRGALERNGFVFLRASGSHHMFFKQGRGVIPVPAHASGIPKGTVASILRRAGLTEGQFRHLLRGGRIPNPLGAVRPFEFVGKGRIQRGDPVHSLRKRQPVFADAGDLAHGQAVEVLTPRGGRFEVRRNDLRPIQADSIPIPLSDDEADRLQDRIRESLERRSALLAAPKSEQVRRSLRLTLPQSKSLYRVAAQPGRALRLGNRETAKPGMLALIDKDLMSAELGPTGLKLMMTGKGENAARQMWPELFHARNPAESADCRWC